VYKFPIRLSDLYLDNLSGVNISAKIKPINIAVIETAIVIRVAIIIHHPNQFFQMKEVPYRLATIYYSRQILN
jgi:hypothetical protein